MLTLKDIKKAFKDKRFKEALELFLELSKSDKELLNQSGGFGIDNLLYNYFRENTDDFCSTLEQDAFRQFPNSFIQALNASQLFLTKNRLDALLSYDLGEYTIHQKFWLNFFKTESELYDRIKIQFSEIERLPAEKVLIFLVFWIEKKRYDDQTPYFTHQLSSVYNFFIKFYLHHTNKKLELSENEFNECFIKQLVPNLARVQENPLSELLESILEWTIFYTDILQVYCFDRDVTVVEENGILYLKQSPKGFYNWKLNGIRYEKNKLDYYKKARKIANDSIRKGEISLIAETEEDIDFNLEGQIGQITSQLILADVFPNKPKETDFFKKVALFISGYSHNRRNRYQDNLNNYRDENWFIAYNEVLKQYLQKEILNPYLIHTENSFVQIVSRMIPDLQLKKRNQIFKQLSYEVDQNKEFNRFNIDYDVWAKPFIEVGSLYFTPIAFFSANDWVYSAVQLAIKQNIELKQKAAEAMEQHLASRFKEKGFSARCLTKDETNKLDGDIDVLVEDEKATLIIQLKRTKLSLDLRGAYNEYIISDKKASLQLNKASRYLSESNELFQLKHQPVKWIVSTSFESVNDTIDGCRKINYFELLFALEREELKTLQDIIHHLEQSVNLLDFYTYDNEDDWVLEKIGLPIKLKEPTEYRIPVFGTDQFDNNANIAYQKLFNKAMSYYGKQDKKAIKLLNQCAYKRPNDISVYAALGNCYANLEDLPNLRRAFNQALEIVPDEPYIKRNYAIALRENEQYFEAISMFIDLYKLYPFVDDFTQLYLLNLKEFINELNDEQQNTIMEKINGIK